MNPRLQGLPDELLVKVLSYLPKSDLKSTRLTCTRYGRIGAQWLFPRVYFAPRKSAIETFLNITANPSFARTVTELVYDGRLFLPEFAAYKPYKEAFDANIPHITIQDRHGVDDVDTADADQAGNGTGPTNNAITDSMTPSWSATSEWTHSEVYYETLANNLVRYTRLVEQQQDILEDQKDYEALLTGLKNLPRITKVTILDDFSGYSEGTPLETDHHSSYKRRFWRENGAIPPAPWPQDTFGAMRNKWDVRGIKNLIRAVSVHCQELTGLILTSGSSSAPMTVFEMDDGAYDAACKMARRFTSIDVKLYRSMNDSGNDMEEQYECLEGFLSRAKELRYLAISWLIDFNLIKNSIWPHLETLILGDVGLKAADLKTLTQAHKGTLCEVIFRNVYMYGGEGWARAAKEMGKYLTLRRVNILGVRDEVTKAATGYSYLDDETNLAVARSFMQSTPGAIVLNENENEYTIVARPDKDSLPVETGDPHSSLMER